MKAKYGEALAFVRKAAASDTDDCIDWPYGTSSGGYGMIYYDGMAQNAHRIALILFGGENHSGMDAAHGSCHNRACVNPRHLSWKTRKENNADKVRDGTNNAGEKHNATHLTNADATNIIHDTRPCAEIAPEYSVDQSTVSRIKRGDTFRYLPRPDAVPRTGATMGELNSKAKLSEREVIEILADERKNTVIAVDYQVTPATIGHIKRGITWQHIPREETS